MGRLRNGDAITESCLFFSCFLHGVSTGIKQIWVTAQPVRIFNQLQSFCILAPPSLSSFSVIYFLPSLFIPLINAFSSLTPCSFILYKLKSLNLPMIPPHFFFFFLSEASLFLQSAEGRVAMRWAQREPAAGFFQSPRGNQLHGSSKAPVPSLPTLLSTELF